MAAREARIKEALADEIASMTGDSEVALRDTLRDVEQTFGDQLANAVREAREENASRLKSELQRIEDLHHSTVAQVAADLRQKIEEEISGARQKLEREIVPPTEFRRAHEEAVAKLKAEQAALQRAAFKLSSLLGKPVETSLTRKSVDDSVGGELKARKRAPNGTCEDEAAYSEYSYSGDEVGAAQAPR